LITFNANVPITEFRLNRAGPHPVSLRRLSIRPRIKLSQRMPLICPTGHTAI